VAVFETDTGCRLTFRRAFADRHRMSRSPILTALLIGAALLIYTATATAQRPTGVIDPTP
jgi:hypothetical protein